MHNRSAMQSATVSLAVLLVATVIPVTRATAQTCAERPVTARGEPSFYEVLAKAKARGNWRAKVRATPALGAAYANWNKALAPSYRCSERAGTVVCIATAHPCRD
jgi:hypothetical protein